jgi:hypothetical protein
MNKRTFLSARQWYRRYYSPLLCRGVADDKIIGVSFLWSRFQALAEEKAAAALYKLDVDVALAQERHRGIDYRGTSPGQIVELEAIAAEVEEAGEGLRAPLADFGIGAEGKPRLWHALEAAERPVGHPGQDLDQSVLRQARHGLVLLVLMFLQMGETVQFRFLIKKLLQDTWFPLIKGKFVWHLPKYTIQLYFC